jgi:carbonic anhydrase
LEYALGRNGPKASFPKSCDGTTLRIPFVEGQFQAVQFHMHIGSEHTIGGKSFESEFHIVHKQIGGDRFAVVGIMLNADAKVDNAKFQRLLDGWDQVAQKVAIDCGDEVLKKKARVATEEFNVYDLIPSSANFYHYDGSLTTPPCSEVVWWNVADVPLSISRDQMDQLIKYTTKYVDPKTCELDPSASPFDGTTNRPTAQDNYGRRVIRICPVDAFN